MHPLRIIIVQIEITNCVVESMDASEKFLFDINLFCCGLFWLHRICQLFPSSSNMKSFDGFGFLVFITFNGLKQFPTRRERNEKKEIVEMNSKWQPFCLCHCFASNEKKALVKDRVVFMYAQINIHNYVEYIISVCKLWILVQFVISLLRSHILSDRICGKEIPCIMTSPNHEQKRGKHECQTENNECQKQ